MVALALWGVSPLVAKSPLDQLESPKGTGSRKARQEAVNTIPWQEIQPAVGRQLVHVVTDPTVYRRMPPRMIACDTRLHQFIVRNPDSLAHLWDHLGITDIHVDRKGQFAFQADDGQGTTSRIDLIYGRPDLHIFHGAGAYEGPLFRGSIRGQGVVVIRSRPYLRPDGKQLIHDQMDVFLKIDSGPADAVAKTIYPLFIRNADYNFVETARFVEKLSEAAANNPPATQSLIDKLTRLHPVVKAEFSEVVRQVSESRPSEVQTGLKATLSGSTQGESDNESSRTQYAVSRYPVDGPLHR